ncbi:MAG: hypothetical protein ACHQVS_01975 [Candidatus Babeliales bacterium]
MWPFPTISNNVLAITCTPQELTCSLIRPTRIARRYELYAHYCYPLKHYELEQLILFNPTTLYTYVQEIITKHRLANSTCVVALQGPSITQRIITSNQSPPLYHQIADPRLKNMQWDYYYLYPEDDGQAAWYVAGIKHALIIQWKLLFSRLPVHLTGITTDSMALLYAYKHLYGSAFRSTQSAIDIKKLMGSSFHGLLSHELMRRALALNSSLANSMLHTSPAVTTALGLFLLGRTAYETN